MAQTIVIDPVTRIEGHAKITLQLDGAGEVAEALFHVTELRGFERFCEGKPFQDMPRITSRICGICPVSHMLASGKAGDAILSVELPEAAERLRRLIHYGQLVQSHALSFFHLSAPDLILGHEAGPARRNLFGLIAEHPEIARQGIRLRHFGQEVIAALSGRRIHGSWVVPGGVDEPMTAEDRDRIRAGLPEAFGIVRHTLDWFQRDLGRWEDEAASCGTFPSLFLGLVSPDGGLEHYDGKIRIVDAAGALVADRLATEGYFDLLGEASESWSYLKFPFYRPLGYPAGLYRVGPLARLNVASHCGTPEADRELAGLRRRFGRTVLSSFHNHYARLIEMLFCLERIAEILDHPDLLSTEVLARARRNRSEGIGCIEAPRGTLFHHYQVDRDGLLTRVNLLVATGQNNLAMNETVLQIARRHIHGSQAAEIPEPLLNRIEAGIRAFDPCLSCATHADGRMPLHVELRAADGSLLAEAAR